MLTPWERVVRELEHEEPDRVPWGGENISQPTADVVLGRPALTGMGGGHRVLELQAEGRHAEANRRVKRDVYDLADKLRMDLVSVGLPPAPSGTKPKLLSPNEWTYDGVRIIRSVEGNLLTIEIDQMTGQRIKHDIEDLEKFVNGLQSGTAELEGEATDELEEVAPLIRDLKRDLDVAILFPVWNCFLTHPDWLSTFLRAFHIRPDLVIRFEKAQAKHAIAFGKAAIDAGCDVIGIGGDLAYRKGPMISPEKYHRFIFPFMRKESRTFHRKGAYSMIASDGNLMPIGQDYFIGSEVDAVREIEPGPMDRAEVKERFGDRVCLNGNVDCGRTLGLLSATDVIRETRECIKIWGPGGGHILSSSNTISPNVKTENFFAMWRAVFRYGKYSAI